MQNCESKLIADCCVEAAMAGCRFEMTGGYCIRPTTGEVVALSPIANADAKEVDNKTNQETNQGERYVSLGVKLIKIRAA
jgi:hypothetical protein